MPSGLTSIVRLIGTVPSPLVPACLMAADVLVSPRERGRNTPLKIFSYLRSGRPIVATDIASHTQVLDEWSSVLVPPSARASRSVSDHCLDEGPARYQAIEGALALQTNYGIERYVGEVARAYTQVGGAETDAAFIDRAAGASATSRHSERTDPHSRHFLAAIGRTDGGRNGDSAGRSGEAWRPGAPRRSSENNEKEAS